MSLSLKKLAALMVVTALGFGCLGLAHWQYQRALAKTAQQAQFIAQQDQPAMPFATFAKRFPTPDAPGKWANVTLTGHWREAQGIVLENYPNGDAVGTLWLAPLQLVGSADTVMVLLGWQALPKFANTAPQAPPSGLLAAAGEMVTLIGRADTPSLSRFQLGHDASNSRSWLSYSAEKFHQQMGISVSPWMVWANPLPQALLDNGWQSIVPSDPLQEFSAAKHWGYMGQWLVFAIMCFLFAVGIIRKKNIDKVP